MAFSDNLIMENRAFKVGESLHGINGKFTVSYRNIFTFSIAHLTPVWQFLENGWYKFICNGNASI